MYLAKSQLNTVNHLALNAIDEDGWLYNPTEVKFKIVDLSTGTAVQVFPAPSGWEVITTQGKVSDGVWQAAVASTELGWAPSGNEGLHRIYWHFTGSDGTTARTWSQDFQVSAANLGAPYRTYISPNEVRTEGLTVAQCSDARLIELILKSQDYIERATRQPFRPVYQTMKVDGNEAHTMHFAIPLIGIEYVKANNSTQTIAHTSLAIYNSPSLESSRYYNSSTDYRRNPRIGLKADLDIYSGAYLGAADVFAVGRRNQSIKGVFGFVEPDGTTPSQITYAMLKLVYATAQVLALSSSTTSTAGPIKKEKVDRHEIEYMESTSSTSTSALSSSPEVEEIIQLYKAPVGIGAAEPRMSSRVRVY